MPTLLAADVGPPSPVVAAGAPPPRRPLITVLGSDDDETPPSSPAPQVAPPRSPAEPAWWAALLATSDQTAAADLDRRRQVLLAEALPSLANGSARSCQWRAQQDGAWPTNIAVCFETNLLQERSSTTSRRHCRRWRSCAATGTPPYHPTGRQHRLQPCPASPVGQ